MLVLAPTRLLIRHRRVLTGATRNEIRGRYAGTALGLAWTVVYPLLFFGVYAAVFVFVFDARADRSSTVNSVLLIGAGLIPFLGFTEALGSGISSVLANRGLIKNTLFPIELIPVRSTLVASITMVVAFTVLLAGVWAHGLVFASQALLPLLVVLQLLLTIGLMWPLAAINVFFKDLGQSIPLIALLLMVLSPIAYSIGMVPSALRWLVYLNPLYYAITVYQDCVVRGVVPARALTVLVILALGSFGLGFALFSRLKPLLAEHV